MYFKYHGKWPIFQYLYICVISLQTFYKRNIWQILNSFQMSDVQTLWYMNDLQSLLHFPCFECFSSGLEFAIETLSIRMKCWVSKMKKLYEWQVSGSEKHLGNPFIQSSPKYSSNYPQPRQGTLFLPPTAIPKPLCPFNACLNREVQDPQNTQFLFFHANKQQGKRGNCTIASLGKTRAQLTLIRGAVK